MLTSTLPPIFGCTVPPVIPGPRTSEIVILLGLARQTARKSRKYHYFTERDADIEVVVVLLPLPDAEEPKVVPTASKRSSQERHKRAVHELTRRAAD